ncbi:MAG: class I SAM-dependent methyltransferase [Xanthomonadaceae bacterium]|jgi:SAM-dependent methyltransferase|nr:class I SAM-dependent methyltransferase [Xanthomonadaceae bacterium]
MHDNPGFWDTEPVASLVAAERAWLESRRVQWPQALELWVHPAAVPAERGCVSLALAADGGLSGPMLARADRLPFADDSVPRVVLQHALDLRPAPRSLLREAVRTLAPGGHLVVFGFDALSPTIWRCRFTRRGMRRAVGMHLPARLAQLGGQLGLSDIHRFGFAAGDAPVREGGWPRPAYALVARKNSRNVIVLRRGAGAEAQAVGAMMPAANRHAESCR